jgi:hypothetical protein
VDPLPGEQLPLPPPQAPRKSKPISIRPMGTLRNTFGFIASSGHSNAAKSKLLHTSQVTSLRASKLAISFWSIRSPETAAKVTNVPGRCVRNPKCRRRMHHKKIENRRLEQTDVEFGRGHFGSVFFE